MEESARPASSGDLDVLIGLAAAARRELPERKGGDVAVRLDPQRNDPGARIATALDDEATVLFVGTIDGTVVGYGLMTLGTVSDGSAQANVEEIFVDPAARSRVAPRSGKVLPSDSALRWYAAAISGSWSISA